MAGIINMNILMRRVESKGIPLNIWKLNGVQLAREIINKAAMTCAYIAITDNEGYYNAPYKEVFTDASLRDVVELAKFERNYPQFDNFYNDILDNRHLPDVPFVETVLAAYETHFAEISKGMGKGQLPSPREVYNAIDNCGPSGTRKRLINKGLISDSGFAYV